VPSDSKIAVVYGTRPEIIKLGPVVRLLGEAAKLINTGQHFDEELSRLIADEMGFREPSQGLTVGGATRGEQIARGLEGLLPLLKHQDAVIVQGDTNSALAGGLAANALEIPLFHVEAGLRSYDRRMPEEHNRVLVDHLADLCWAPTEGNVENLAAEGISASKVVLTGNTIVDALHSLRPAPEHVASLLQSRELSRRGFVLTTLHRPENVDDAVRLEKILRALAGLRFPVLFPMHPRTVSTIKSAGLEHLLESISVLPPVGYVDFLALMSAAALVVSDSGGVQEEVSVLKVPMVVLRRSTERPEVIGTFAQLTDDPAEMVVLAETVITNATDVFDRLTDIPSPYGSGNAAKRIVDSMRVYLS
jgi:UDP-N-acetylglucosamine 2-epimerase (non-hydrolysing)